MNGRIDIRRLDRVILRCPWCGMVRELPPNWQAILRESTAGPDWDGKLRCQNDHEPTVMVVQRGW